MEGQKEKIRTADLKFYELCEEVDMWKDESAYWQEKYENLLKEHNDMVRSSIRHNEGMIAGFLKLIINKDITVKKPETGK